MAESGRAEAQSTGLCSTHGLRYDPARHTGCVVCRREAAAAAPAPEPTRAVPRSLVRALLALAAVLVLSLVVVSTRDLSADLHALLAYARELTGEEAPAKPRGARAAQDDSNAETPRAAATPAASASQAAASGDSAGAEPTSACSRAALGLDAIRDVSAQSAGELQRAAAHGDAAKVLEDIRLGARVDEPDAAGRTALAWAGATGHFDIARALLDARANPNLAAQGEVTPLMLAAEDGAPRLVALLLERGAHRDASDAHARSALIYAARANRAEVISVLLQHGAVLQERCELGMTALHHAADSCECPDAVQRLLAARAEIDAPDMRGASALMLAAQAGHADVVSSLLDAGARLDLRDHQGLGAVDYVVRPRGGLDAAQQRTLFAVLQLLLDRDPDPHLALDASQTQILFRAQLDDWLRSHNLPALPAYAPSAARVEPVQQRPDDTHAALRLFAAMPPVSSESLPVRSYQDCTIGFRGFVARICNVVAQARVSGLSLSNGQQITLSADAAGNVPWGVDDAMLLERMLGFTRVDSAFAGQADGVFIAQQPVQRIGQQAQRYSRGAIDFTQWLSNGSGVDRVLVSVVDWGGSAGLSEIWLHVYGPHAASTIKNVKVETVQAPK